MKKLTPRKSKLFKFSVMGVFIFLGSVLTAQTTTVPDDNFENYLETHDASGNVVPLGDANSMGNGIANDNLVFTNRINTVTSLDVGNLSIADLTGIEGFAALQNLFVYQNNLTSVNLSSNTNLQKIRCQFNQLTALDLSNNTNITEVYCNSNQITSLDLSSNTQLVLIDCSNNSLTSLNVQNGNNSNVPNSSFDSRFNANLFCVQVDNVAYSTANWTSIDAQTSFSTDCSNFDLTNVPDDNFENYLETHDASGNVVPLGDANSMGNGIANDNYVFKNRINTVTNLDVSNKSIADLTGIEDFTALTNLSCNNNTITAIDVSNSTALVYINCSANSLTQLNVKNGNNTNMPNSGFLATGNPNLTCIEVDDVNYSTSNWTNIDGTASFSLNCYYGLTYVPDTNFEGYLEQHDTNGNFVNIGDPNSLGNGVLDDYVPTNKINTLTALDVNNNNISDLTGIEDFVALTQLLVYSNQLTALNISNLPNLTLLRCEGNQLTVLNVSAQTQLQTLHCQSNQLTALDVSANTALTSLLCSSNSIASLNVDANTQLTELNCSFNQLTELSIKNGNNTNMPNSNFDARNNAGLTCISVDDPVWSTSNWTNIDAQTGFSFDCSSTGETTVPDDNFENYLETHDKFGNVVTIGAANSMGNGIANDDKVFTNRINIVTTLNVPGLSVSDLTGIEDFISLTNLDVSNNTLTGLNVSALTQLTNLNANGNSLTSINVSGANALTQLYLNNNNLTGLNVSTNTALTTLYCAYNSLTALDVSANTQLVTLSCSDNSLTGLSLSSNTVLENLTCGFNSIASINLSANTALKYLDIASSGLTSIDLSSNIALISVNVNTNSLNVLDLAANNQLTYVDCSDNSLVDFTIKNGSNTLIPTNGFFATGNPNLLCIEVDDPAWSTTNWTNKDAQTAYSLNCASSALTYVPDDNFENYLETHDINGNVVTMGDPVAMGNGVMDDQVKTNRIAAVTGLYINDLNIADLTGIADFDALITLSCYNNNLTTLNTSGAAVLENLDASGNSSLSTINVSGNTALKQLQLNLCDLATLDVSNNALLEELRCSDNNLNTLDVSANTALKTLHCSDNNLTQLDVSNNTQLINLSCSTNQLTNLNLDANTALTYLSCVENQLTELHIQNGNNTNMPNGNFYANNNPNLTCIFVDDAAWSTANWTNIDSNANFVETQSQCDALGVTEFNTTEIMLYPNPSNGSVFLKTNEVLKRIEIYSINGRKLRTFTSKEFSIKDLENGIYLVQIQLEKTTVIKRIIKR